MGMVFANGQKIIDKRSALEEIEEFKILNFSPNETHSYTGGKGTYFCISNTGETRSIPMQLAMLFEDFKKLKFAFNIGDAVCTVDTQPPHATKWEVTSIHPAWEPDRDEFHNHRYYCKGPSKDYGTCGMYERQMVDWYKWNGKHKPSTPKFAKNEWVCLKEEDNKGFAEKLKVSFVHVGDGVNAHKYDVVDVDGAHMIVFQGALVAWDKRTNKSIPLIEGPGHTTVAHDAQKILEFSYQLDTMVMNLETKLLNKGRLPQFYHLVKIESSGLANLIQEIWNHNKLNIEENNGQEHSADS